jgi:hypothetical protein
MKYLWAILLALALAASAYAQPGAWPGGRQAAIALTYDDALRSQLDNAIPQLNAARLKGTIFLTGREIGEAWPRWRAAAAAGHELGNHTINHPCARGTYEMPEQYTSEAYSVATILTEIGVMNTLLEALDGRAKHAFATPCVQNLAGGEDYLGPLQQARSVGHIRDHRAMPGPTDAPPVFVQSFENASGADMIAWVEEVRRAGGAGIVVFHGVGGDHIPVSADAHRDLLAHLRANRGTIWTATYSDVMDAIAAQRTR